MTPLLLQDSIGEHDGLDDESVHGVSALTPEESPIRKPMAPGAMILDAELGDSNAAFYATVMDIILRQVDTFFFFAAKVQVIVLD